MAVNSLQAALSAALQATHCGRYFSNVQIDTKDGQIAALQREVKLLRAENAYLRDQVSYAIPIFTSSELQAAEITWKLLLDKNHQSSVRVRCHLP